MNKKIRGWRKILSNIRENYALILRYPHEISNKIDQKQQLRKIYINTRTKTVIAKSQSDCGNLMDRAL